MVHNRKILPKALFYILSVTWGILPTLMGCVTILTLKLYGKITHKEIIIKKHGYCYYIAIGKNWGGFEMGLFFLTDDSDNLHTKNHELGHGVQNCYWGPLMLPVITIPSMIRYWYREFKYWRKGITPPTDYDAIWFEGDASLTGYKYIENIK